MRRRLPWWVLALAFVMVPIAEIYLLIQLGQAVGPWWTVLILLADGVLGSFLVKREGGRAWRALQEALTSRRMPATELADGALILVGGTLLLTPGFLSDLVGLFCILPFTRPIARRVLTRVITRRLASGVGGRSGRIPGGTGGPWQASSGATRARPDEATRGPGGPVVPGEVVDDDQ